MSGRRSAARKVTNGKGQRFYAKGQNSKNGEVFRRGPDLVPRRQLQRGVLLKALTEEELRDIRTGKRVNGKANKRYTALVRGAMLEDMAIAFRRVAYACAHESGRRLQEALGVARAIVGLGDHLAEHLDQKPASVTRSTEFVFSGPESNQEVPTATGQAKLSPAEDGYETVDPDEFPDAR